MSSISLSVAPKLESGENTTPLEQSTTRQPHIVFQDGDEIRPDRRGLAHGSRRRSVSRDSISSVRSRTHSASGIPIEFRTISFQVSESQAIGRSISKEGKPTKKTDDKDYFENLDFHILNSDDVCRQFNVFLDQGLSNGAAAARLQRNGKNVLPQRRENYLMKLLGYIFGGFCSVLWIGVIIFFICWRPLGNPPAAYNLGLAILVLIVIFLQACFSAFQDWSTKRTMNSILDLLPSEALVLRESGLTKIPSSDLVVGDIVQISIGNKVPADIRLLNTSGDIRFDRSMLTGEPEEVEGATDMTDANFLETRNIALTGTMVTNGNATGIVVLTGGNTVMGRIAKATAGVEDTPTLIQREISRFVKIIVFLTICLASLLLFTWIGWLRVDHPEFMNVVAMLNDVMGCVVAFIPEGMPVGVALTLMMIARRMKSSNVLPKGLSTVETLGCVNVICSDKTGTLTENKMSVMSVGFVDKFLSVDEANRELAQEKEAEALSRIHRASLLCNDATFDPLTKDLPIMERKVQGNATDAAVLRFAEAARSSSSIHNVHSKVFQIPFNSKNKWMMTLNNTPEFPRSKKNEKQTYLAVVKGAPDVLLPKCTSYWSYQTNSTQSLDEDAKSKFSDLQIRLSRNAERVILLCERTYSPTAVLNSNDFGDEIVEHCMRDLTIIGVLGILDPPRPETAATVASCRRARIRFFMVTGDFGLTGAAIARSVGIFTGTADPDTYETIRNRRYSVVDGQPFATTSNKSLLLEGSQLNQLEESDWDLICAYEEIVFGRTTPEQKLRIVNEFKDRDNVVAVTGDGVNDAPALRAADVGIAIVSGSDVALEAADLVLMDKFDSIVEAIRLGRLVFQNLQKVIGYLLPAGSWSEIWPVLMNVFFGFPLPLSSFLMIIICVFTDLFLSLSLIMEKEEFDLLDLPPRNAKKDHLINIKIYIQSYLFIGVMETICAHSMYFLYLYKHARIPFHALAFAFEKYSDGFYGYTEAELLHFQTVGQCVYFVTLVILQWGNILSIRNKRLSILQADPFRKGRRNLWLFGGALASFVIAVFVTEVRGIQNLFGTASVPIEFWLLPLPLALGILIMDELRKLVVRNWPQGPIAKIAW
ncbi:putative Na/K ATPase alpha 1 subunit [Lepidopterella palustris CBS 459.81]|uniref:Putative Na/K ATPase alpha 1 subunit n=1 Tax=Lepidopterella palustris CBS 459.81 TaxID=1314670 RepID=A0A8E2JG61_9PEZI|nr:putative Na/K ATPase alpha 1 subunit [Lepidopterella palustris CBS 459.81]